MTEPVTTVSAGTVAGVFGIFVLLFFLIWLFAVVGGILLIVFWILMIVDVAKRDFKKENDKILWILVVVLASWIGAIIYYFMVKRKDKH